MQSSFRFAQFHRAKSLNFNFFKYEQHKHFNVIGLRQTWQLLNGRYVQIICTQYKQTDCVSHRFKEINKKRKIGGRKSER